MDHRLDTLQQSISDLRAILAGISSGVPAKGDRVETLFGSLVDIVTASSLFPNRAFIQQSPLISRDDVATIMRQAIGDTLQPVLKASMGKSTRHNAMILKQLQDIRNSFHDDVQRPQKLFDAGLANPFNDSCRGMNPSRCL